MSSVSRFPSCFWSAQSVESNCARLFNPTQPPRCRKSFLAHVSMTSEQGGHNTDTFYLFIYVYGNYYVFFFSLYLFFVVTIIELFIVLYSGCLCILLL